MSSSSLAPPAIVLGTSAIRMLVVSRDSEKFQENFDAIKKSGIRHIETAAIYPIHAQGESEKWVGEGGYVQNGFAIDTKIFYGDLSLGGKGHLKGDAVGKSLDKSLAALKCKKLNVLYIHGPDYETPLIEQAASFDAQYKAGKFSALGISNFTPDFLSKYLDVAIANNYVKPTVYSGQYNVLCRTYETTLFPLLREHKMSFVAYSPLGGGFLTGKLTFSKEDQDLKGTRFEVGDGNYMGMGFRHWYDHPAMHTAIKKMKEFCDESGIGMADAAWRWVLFHSALDSSKGDKVIIGPSKISQLEQYVEGVEAGPLPDELVKKLDGLWEVVKDEAANIVVY